MPNEYIIPLSIDVAGVVQKAQTVSASLKDVGTAATKAGADAKKGFEDAAKGSTDLGSKIVDNSAKVTLLTKNVEQLKIQLQSYQAVASKSLDPKVITEYNAKVETLKTQIAQLSNQGKQGFNELGQAVEKNTNLLGKAFSSLRTLANILPGVGIAGILAFAIGPIVEYISKLDFVKKSLETLTQAQKDYSIAFQDTGYQKAIGNISELTENIKLAKEGFLDKTKVLKQYNTELGSSIGYADSLDEAEQNIVKHGEAFIQVTLLKAAAQIALGDAAKKAAEAAQVAAKPTNTFVSFGSESLQALNLLGQGRFSKQVADAQKADQDRQVADLKKQADTQLKIFNDFQKKAADLAKKNGIDFFDGTQDPKTVKDNTDELLAKRKALLDQLAKLQNDFNSAQIAGIEDAETKEVAQNDVNFQNKIRTLQQQQKDLIDEAKRNKFPSLAPLIQDNIREISLLIAEAEREGQAADVAIINKYAALKLKAQQDSIRAIGVLLKDETQARVDAINANYDKVTIEAKKNGVLTDALEKKLAQQRQSDISDIESKAILDRLTRNNELEIAFIESQGRRPGELQATFDQEQQRAILANDLAFQKKRIEILTATLAINGALTPDQTKQLADAVKKFNKDTGQDQSNKESDKSNIFKALGVDNDTEANIKRYAEAASTVGRITSDLFSNLQQGAEQQVTAIQKQIDALNNLIQADQNAVDKQQALFDKGRANSLDAAKKQLADDLANKAKLQKQAEDAQKKANELKKAELVADSISQVSNLITAATEIYKSVSVIPVIGPALAFATVAAMFASFAAAKVVAFNSVNSQSAEEGGIAGGDRHSSGGNKYVSMDGKDRNILEIERGERIFSRKNTEKHKALFEAIQNNDYSRLDINDVSIRDLLHGTGVMQQLEVAKRTGNQNITLQDRANNVVIIGGNSDKYLSSIDKKMDNLNRKEPIVIDYGDYIWIDRGNGYTEKRYK